MIIVVILDVNPFARRKKIIDKASAGKKIDISDDGVLVGEQVTVYSSDVPKLIIVGIGPPIPPKFKEKIIKPTVQMTLLGFLVPTSSSGNKKERFSGS